MEAILTEDFVSEKSEVDYDINIEADFYEDSIKERALSELYEANIINEETSYRTWTIENKTESGESLARSTFVIFGDVCYFSWIWVKKFLRGHGIGSRLLSQSLKKIQDLGAKEVYVLTKSEKAISIFESKGFQSVESPSGYHYKKF